MRTIAHISDLHFGREDKSILPVLAAALTTAKPDVVVVSGDLTQRARSAEFAAARAFLDTLPGPQIVVPGNHDIPLFNVLARWRAPLEKYRRFITKDLEPFFADEEIAVLGINTARSLTFKNGRLNSRQVADSCRRMQALENVSMRILVTHHPFDVPSKGAGADIVGRARMAMAEFARCKIDLILTGHLHVSRTSHSGSEYGGGSSALFIQAGTATSFRQRGELNAWNLIQIAGDEVGVGYMGWTPGAEKFELLRDDRFRRSASGWVAQNAAHI